MHQANPACILLVVGDYEERDRPSERAVEILRTLPGVRCVGWQSDIVPFMAAMDVVVLPTYREGLGNVLLEAAAMEKPTITTTATGARDAIVPERTGLMAPPGQWEPLKDACNRGNHEGRCKHVSCQPP